MTGATPIIANNLPIETVLKCYMKPKKFLLFLNNGIKLTRADIFTKDDPFEAEYTEASYSLFKEFKITYKKPNEPRQNYCDFLKDQCNRIRKHAFVSCWTKGSKENVALWRLYGGNGNGVAIQTTVGKLVKEIEYATTNTEQGKRLHLLKGCKKRIVKIKYIDHHQTEYQYIIDSTNPNPTNILHYKNEGYEYENEIRIIFDTYQNAETGKKAHSRLGESISIRIRPDTVIDKILISPYACKCYFDSVKKIMSEYDATSKVEWSHLKFVPGEPS